jgi:hypothetical protein
MLTEGIEHALQHFVSPREMAKSLGITVDRLSSILRYKKLLKPIEIFGRSRRHWYVDKAVAVFKAIKDG